MSDSRQSAKRFREAKADLDKFIARREAEKATGRAVITGDENDPEYATLTNNYWKARDAAPWWAKR